MRETICLRGHVEPEQPGPYGGYEYVGREVCQRRFADGTPCASPIVHSFALLDENERPGPDDSVAPGILLSGKLDAAAAAPGAERHDEDEAPRILLGTDLMQTETKSRKDLMKEFLFPDPDEYEICQTCGDRRARCTGDEADEEDGDEEPDYDDRDAPEDYAAAEIGSTLAHGDQGDRHVDPWALYPPTPLSTWAGLLVTLLAAASFFGTIYFALRGH